MTTKVQISGSRSRKQTTLFWYVDELPKGATRDFGPTVTGFANKTEESNAPNQPLPMAPGIITFDNNMLIGPLVKLPKGYTQFDVKNSTNGFITISQGGLSQIFEENFLKILKGTQHKSVIYRRVDVVIYSSVPKNADGTIPFGENLKEAYSLFLLSGRLSSGNADSITLVNTRAFVFNCSLQNLSSINAVDKPNRVLILGTPFKQREDFLKNDSVFSLENLFLNGFRLPLTSVSIYVKPIVHFGDSLRFCRQVSIEGLSRVAGKKGEPIDLPDVEIR